MTPDHKIVWEFISPYKGTFVPMNMTYRAYRVPYEWVPQAAKPAETPIRPLDVATFRVPGAAALGDRDKEVSVEGCVPYEGSNALCVAPWKTRPTSNKTTRGGELSPPLFREQP